MTNALSYGEVFQYEFDKANGKTEDENYCIAAIAVIAEFQRRTKQEKVREGIKLPSATELAESFCDYLPGARWIVLSIETQNEFIRASEQVIESIKVLNDNRIS